MKIIATNSSIQVKKLTRMVTGNINFKVQKQIRYLKREFFN